MLASKVFFEFQIAAYEAETTSIRTYDAGVQIHQTKNPTQIVTGSLLPGLAVALNWALILACSIAVCQQISSRFHSNGKTPSEPTRRELGDGFYPGACFRGQKLGLWWGAIIGIMLAQRKRSCR